MHHDARSVWAHMQADTAVDLTIFTCLRHRHRCNGMRYHACPPVVMHTKERSAHAMTVLAGDGARLLHKYSMDIAEHNDCIHLDFNDA
jgi:hypothetical protein